MAKTNFYRFQPPPDSTLQRGGAVTGNSPKDSRRSLNSPSFTMNMALRESGRQAGPGQGKHGIVTEVSNRKPWLHSSSQGRAQVTLLRFNPGRESNFLLELGMNKVLFSTNIFMTHGTSHAVLCQPHIVSVTRASPETQRYHRKTGAQTISRQS